MVSYMVSNSLLLTLNAGCKLFGSSFYCCTEVTIVVAGIHCGVVTSQPFLYDELKLTGLFFSGQC